MVNFFQDFGYMVFGYRVISDIWSILAGPDVDHISGTQCILHTYTESCKIIPAKFRELSLNFPKLADWLCMSWQGCLAALRQEISNMQE